MQIIPLAEGSFTIDKTKQFVPFNQAGDDLQSRPTGSLLVEIRPFLVITKKDLILLDTGLGFSDTDGLMQIHGNLEKSGYKSTDITKVLLSHLHKDHAGGISEDKDRGQLCFPNATYYVREDEFKFANEKGLPSYIPEEFALLQNSKQVKWITDENGVIDGYIEYLMTGAHSPCHQVFWIREDGQTIFFGADDAPQLQQMKHRFVAKYDYDGKKAMELRKEWWEQGQREGWELLYYH